MAATCSRWMPALLCLMWLPLAAAGASPQASADFERCLLEAVRTADDSATLGELRQRCRREARSAGAGAQGAPAADTLGEPESGAVERRLAADDRLVPKPFRLMAHNPNYFLFASYNASGVDPGPFRERENDPTLETDDVEAKFQISFKMPLLVALFDNRADVYAAYTNRSFWQVYNSRESSPFREIDHEPEAWIQLRGDREWMGVTHRLSRFGIAHQSNGRGGSLSRSWNRLYADVAFELGNLAVNLKPWYRIPEDGEGDDNPDITDYLGHGEVRGAYRWKGHAFSLMLRNNLESGFSRGAVELGWSFPLWTYPHFKGYVQYFHGYGESLIDYDEHANSVGAGILLTDWL